ncbi:SDR family oxidoreductase [Chelativorans sp. Marseille-P2723]|uniref:SDR family NAD(P)-dependent oxidoreductase n=1 Tax=Chelativorans sp. Marseille-P2723 TaxID=2709133 RepID=UPI001570D740|nr:SDR family oxidoreductase [Chelativorans sp. Marseille-P2723]
MSNLDGKIIVITGSARGIGARTAEQLALQGAHIAVTARSIEGARSAADAIAATGGSAVAVECDVSDLASVESMVSQVRERFGRIDGLINNAAVIDPIGRIVDTDPHAWMRAIKVNLVGAYHAVRATLPVMLQAGKGTIVNLSSGAAFHPLEGWSAYCASKAGLAMLTRSIHLEYGADGIVAVGFSPGVVDTGMQEKIRESGINPVSRLPRASLADPSEPARALAYLCSDAGRRYAGEEVDIRDPDLRTAAGLLPVK